MTIGDRAHARDIAEMDRELAAIRRKYPRCREVNEAVSDHYIRSYRKLGAADPHTVDLLQVSDALLDEMNEGRDLPDDIALAVMSLLEDRA